MAARFSARRAAAIDRTKYLRLRAGPDHRFIAVWVVVVDRRAFVRSWNDKPTGWARAFRDDPHGAILLDDREITVRARPLGGARTLDAMEAAYAAKYTTKANAKYVEGFAAPERRGASFELVPTSAPRAKAR